MMSFSSVSSGSDAAGYFAKDNYYSRDQLTEASGWMGKGADALGLKGPVDEQTFADLLDGKLPNGAIIRSPSDEHLAGWDITLSAPKSVSLVALVGGDERIVEAMQESVEATLAWIESHLIEARVWDKEAGAQVPENTGNMVVASFTHDVNRNNEPQLHIHNVIANASLASDGRWHAVRNELLYNNQHLIGSIHSAELRTRIEALGYETEHSARAIDGNFEIVGVSRETIEAYSSRTDEINEHVAQTGYDSARAREIAAKETRSAKQPDLSRNEVVAGWQATARKAGFDPAPLIAASQARQAGNQTIWSRAAEGLRSVGAVGMAFAARMGLTPRDGDQLVPERLGRLDPVSFAAAQAVASAVRELGEREAAFARNDVLRHALQHHGPFTVEQLEARIDLLVDKKLLIAGERLMTSEGAIALEQRAIGAVRAGNSAAQPIATSTDLAARLQVAANEQGLRRLNAGQVQAGIDVLSSTDRVHLIQGSAGAGKSAALGPVAAEARAQGHSVIALSHVGRTAREFGVKVGEKGQTIDSFLGQHRAALNGAARPERVDEARARIGGAVIMVDEASQVGTERFAQLTELANRFEAARVIWGGDKGQLGAMDAGKPYEDLQAAGQATSHLSESLRFQSEQTIALSTALNAGDIARAFAILEPDTITVAQGEVAQTAARMWAALDKPERDSALLLASGRAMRSAANEAAQAELRAKGEIGQRGETITVLDRVTITREGARQLRGYQEGRIVEFSTNLPRLGFEKGERGTIAQVKDGKVELMMKDGELRSFDPARLPRNLSHDAVTLFAEKQITLHDGDRIRWTATDAERDIRNGDFAQVSEVSPLGFTAQMSDGQLHRIEAGDRMHERHDLGYAANVHVAQGLTAKIGIMMMSAHESMLNSAQAFLVAVTRFAEQVTLVVDDPAKVTRDVACNLGGKTSAIEETLGFDTIRQGSDLPPAGEQLPAAEPGKRDFGHGEDQPEFDPSLTPQIEPSRDFDIGM